MCKILLIIKIFLIVLTILLVSSTLGDITINVVNNLGYPIEKHGIETKDGFKLTMHRIPSYSQNKNYTSKTVLLVHGILCSSSMWVMNMNNNATSLAFMLSDSGYDVWMLNVRGTTVSKEHMRLSADEPQYWNFSWHEMGVEDIPAAIDYILNKTKAPKLNYICHSQGCTAILVTLSMKPEYNSKISAAYFLAPAAFMQHISGIIPNTLRNRRNQRLSNSLESLGLYAIKARNNTFSNTIRTFCRFRALVNICTNMMGNMIGRPAKSTNGQKLLRFLINDIGDNSALKQFTHYVQNMRSTKFQMFDYGLKKNNDIYFGDTPFEYNLTEITIPISILRATHDPLATKEDIEMLAKHLRNAKSIKIMPGNHIDYIFNPKTITTIKDHMLNVMENNAI